MSHDPAWMCFPHPAVVEIDQPAGHTEKHNAATGIPAQASPRSDAMLRQVTADGASKVAARHVLRPAMSPTGTDTVYTIECALHKRKVAQVHATKGRGKKSCPSTVMASAMQVCAPR